eukprot:824774-Prymnesium_polylepis.1
MAYWILGSAVTFSSDLNATFAADSDLPSTSAADCLTVAVRRLAERTCSVDRIKGRASATTVCTVFTVTASWPARRAARDG